METTTAVEALTDELRALLGDDGVTTDHRVRERVSVDGATMSPLILELLPLGLADVVAFPTSAEQIAACVAAAVRHRVPVTPRGKGTGNYGQAIPMPAGLVLDLTRARAMVEVGDGWVYSAGVADFAVEQMKKLEIASNGDNDYVGDMDEARIQKIIDIAGPIYTDAGAPPKAGLVAKDLYTNEFLDPTIALPAK